MIDLVRLLELENKLTTIIKRVLNSGSFCFSGVKKELRSLDQVLLDENNVKGGEKYIYPFLFTDQMKEVIVAAKMPVVTLGQRNGLARTSHKRYRNLES